MKTQIHPRCFLLTVLSLNLASVVSAQPASIDYQPRSQTVILYQQAAFGVIASGTAPLGYQWRKDGVPIAGATNDQIVLKHPQFSDAGLYSVVVANAENSVTSTDAVLTVTPPKAGDIDCSFACGGSILDGWVQSIALQPDGRVVIAGNTSPLGGAARGWIGRLSADRTTDYTFMNGLTEVDSDYGYSEIRSVALQNDGKVLIGGEFTVVNGVGRTNIARLNPDGTLDRGFQNGLAGADGPVRSVTVQRDGKVLIGGSFTAVNGVSRNGIARLNTDGTLDSDFGDGLLGGEGYVLSVALQRDGKVLIGGSFTAVNGVSRTNIARLNADGTLDRGFQNGLSGANNSVSSIAVQADGKVLLGGWFTEVNGVGRTNIARLDADGTLDTIFQAGVVGGQVSYVSSLVVQMDGKVLIAGAFLTVSGVGLEGIGRLDADGMLEGSFQGVIPTCNNGQCWRVALTIAVQSDGKVLVGGSFPTVNGVECRGFARLNADGSLEGGFTNEAGGYGSVGAVAVQPDGKVLTGGAVMRVDGVSRHWIARLNANGTLDTTFKNGLSGLTGDYHGYVRSVVVQSDGKVLIGGGFSRTNEVGAGPDFYSILRLNDDGTLDTNFQAVGNCDVYSVAVQGDGKILAGGDCGIQRLNADGTLDGSFQTRLSGPPMPQWLQVNSVAVQSDGKVLIGGSFDTVNGVGRTNIARLNADGALDTAFQNGLSGFVLVNSVVAQNDGKALIGGWFAAVNGGSGSNILRLNADGTLDRGFPNGVSVVDSGVADALLLQTDGKVLVGGAGGIARLNADGTPDSGFQATLSDGAWVSSIAVQGDGKVFIVGGLINTVNGLPAEGSGIIARLWGSANIPPQMKSINRSGTDVNLSWYAISNRTYRVQYDGDLSANNWTDLAGDVSATSPTVSKTDTTSSDATQRFYRVLLVP